MRVLHVLHTSVPALAGYTVRTDYIVRFQKAQGMELAAVTSSQHPDPKGTEETIDGVTYHRTPALERKLPVGLRELTLIRRLQQRVGEVIARFRPDVVHAHSPMLVGIPALHAARRHGVPIVYELRDMWENPSIDRGKIKEGSLLHRGARMAEDYMLHRADALVAICASLRAEIERRKGAKVPLFVVDNGVDVDRFTPRQRRPELAARFGLEGKKVLSYLGTFQPYEGVDMLVRAIPRVIERVPDAHLLIVGGGGELPALQELARSIGADKHVTFTGRVPHAEVGDMFPLADLFVYPRILTRTTALTTPLKPLEAMSMARPVLVSDIPPMRELILEPDVTGLLFRPGDQADLERVLISALLDPERLARMGTAARESAVRERAWSIILPRYQQIYQAAIDQRRGR